VKEKRSFLGGLKKWIGSSPAETIVLGPEDRLRLSGKSLRVACREHAFVVELGKQTLHVCPDQPLGRNGSGQARDFLLFDPGLHGAEISQSLRLKPGHTLAIDHREPSQKLVFSRPKHAFRRHLQISHNGDSLDFKDPISELGTYLSLMDVPDGQRPLDTQRRRRAQRIREIFGGPIEALPTSEALELLQEVNALLVSDPYRRKDAMGNAGGLLELPVNLTPVIIGDLHGQVDNLLKILLENAFLETLERGESALVFLGDAVHPEEKGELGSMESSVLIMDLILKLKRQFPSNVFFLIGNHDSFSPDVMKGGVAQSLEWEKHIRLLRGEEYVRQMSLFYRHSPLFVLSKHFLACHAGPPRSEVSIETLVEARQFPELVHQLTWNRIKSKSWPMGYTKGDVKRMRKSLGIEDERPFIVAHYPQEASGSVWLNVGEIPNHHIIYSARPYEVGLFTRVKGEMVAQVYPAEKLTFALETVNDQTI